jgi:hypothetical protein
MSTEETKTETIEEKDNKILKEISILVCQQPGGNRNKRRIKQYGGNPNSCLFKIGNQRENRIMPIISDDNPRTNALVTATNSDAIISNMNKLSTLEMLPGHLLYEIISKNLKPYETTSLSRASKSMHASIANIYIPVQLIQNTKFRDDDIIRCISEIVTMVFYRIRQSYSEMTRLKLFIRKLKTQDKICIGKYVILYDINLGDKTNRNRSHISFKTDSITKILSLEEEDFDSDDDEDDNSNATPISDQVFGFVNTIDVKKSLSKCTNEELKTFFGKYEYYMINSDKVEVDEILEMRENFNTFKTNIPQELIYTKELKYGFVNINIPTELYASLATLGIQEVSYDDLIGVLTYYKMGTHNEKAIPYFKNLVKIKIEKEFVANYGIIDTRFIQDIIQEKGNTNLILVKFSIISIVKNIVALSQKIENVSVFDLKIFHVILHIYSYLNILKIAVDESNISKKIEEIHSIIDNIGKSYHLSVSQQVEGFAEEISKTIELNTTTKECLSQLQMFINEINTEFISQFSPHNVAFWNSLNILEVYTFLNQTNKDDSRIMKFFDKHGRIKNNEDLFIFLKEKYINKLLDSLTKIEAIQVSNITEPTTGFATFVTNSINFNNIDALFGDLFPKPGGGSRPTKQLKKTDSRIKYQGRTRIVYVGKRGGKYIKIKGDMVSLSYLLGKNK